MEHVYIHCVLENDVSQQISGQRRQRDTDLKVSKTANTRVRSVPNICEPAMMTGQLRLNGAVRYHVTGGDMNATHSTLILPCPHCRHSVITMSACRCTASSSGGMSRISRSSSICGGRR